MAMDMRRHQRTLMDSVTKIIPSTVSLIRVKMAEHVTKLKRDMSASVLLGLKDQIVKRRIIVILIPVGIVECVLKPMERLFVLVVKGSRGLTVKSTTNVNLALVKTVVLARRSTEDSSAAVVLNTEGQHVKK